jgi:hypothetical protein
MYFSKPEYENQNMCDEFSYSRGRPPTESISRIADWDINDSIIPRVNFYIYFLLCKRFTIVIYESNIVFSLLLYKSILLLLSQLNSTILIYLINLHLSHLAKLNYMYIIVGVMKKIIMLLCFYHIFLYVLTLKFSIYIENDFHKFLIDTTYNYTWNKYLLIRFIIYDFIFH